MINATQELFGPSRSGFVRADASATSSEDGKPSHVGNTSTTVALPPRQPAFRSAGHEGAASSSRGADVSAELKSLWGDLCASKDNEAALLEEFVAKYVEGDIKSDLFSRMTLSALMTSLTGLEWGADSARALDDLERHGLPSVARNARQQCSMHLRPRLIHWLYGMLKVQGGGHARRRWLEGVAPSAVRHWVASQPGYHEATPPRARGAAPSWVGQFKAAGLGWLLFSAEMRMGR